jgi:predicted CXXCH cytochrome family protein
MKRLGRVLGSLLAVALTVFSLQAFAAAQMGGRDFNHMTTGFILSGGHAVAACETCHIGGVFKGTPRACDGCHAVGKRIIATPKTNSHIVTDAPCESCHFNTATWLGARFNHGTAQPGQCATCHNGRLSFAKPSTHNVGNKATKACDSCHRSSSWLPASWNHNGVVGVCSSCHVSSPEVSTPNRKPVSHALPLLKGDPAIECDACHLYSGWYPNRFKHNTGGTCSSCHLNGAKAIGQPTSHNSFISWPTECNECHTTAGWTGALGAKPANHIPYTSGTCSSCHTGSAIKTGATLHAYVSTVCTTCHLKGGAVYLGNMDKKGIGHEGMGSGDDCSMSGCHKPAGNKGTAYINWD